MEILETPKSIEHHTEGETVVVYNPDKLHNQFIEAECSICVNLEEMI